MNHMPAPKKKSKKKKLKLNKSTRVIPVRLGIEHLEALKSLPEGVSVSALIRTLVSSYLAGSLPASFLEQVYDEVARTNLAIKTKQQIFTAARREAKASEREQKQDGQQQQRPARARACISSEALRERIFLSFNNRVSEERSSPDSM